ncbi:uncharacterized protein LOC6046429 [Culex quinquefasciatus]|uniref:uncharacterized protein LOC6046429 n=1 Tax=Culex quinquefasciatus TaxID=7176 RepID=UPI0018E3A2C6|nr:uncharacterized protein LOC6046429 [Culex quinquefasciatus]
MVCDADAFGGGWFVIQQRLHGGLSFQRDWQEYKNGFGSVGKSNEFWLGLERMHRLTKNEDCELMLELRDESGRYGYALYSGFKVAGEGDSYRLSDDLSFVEGSSIGDKMIGLRSEQFSTPDRDNGRSLENCETKFGSGWWFKDCKSLNLNGPYMKDPTTGRGIYWDGWTNAATYSRMMIRRARQTLQQDVKPFIEDCKKVKKSGTNSFRPAGFSDIFAVYCEAEAFGGGWLVLQQRINGTENFNRNWNDYKHGFGTVGKSTEFWLGLERMHQITSRKPFEMLIEVKNEEGQHGYATFSKFKVADESDGYRLFDEFRWSEGMINFGLQLSHGEQFSTYDKDNDKSSENCGSLYKGGWWFYKCRHSNLNGPYKEDPKTHRGIFCHDWAQAATYSRMMIRST